MPDSNAPTSTAANLAVLFVAVTFLTLTIELVSCSVLAHIRPEVPTKEITPLYALEGDPDLGYALHANIEHRAAKARADGAVCYDVTYRTDRFRRRTVFQHYDVSNRHLILFGGSVTFGEGLAEEDTLQFQLMQQFPRRNVYNYAVHGYGPSQMLAKLESGAPADEVASHRGDAIYVMIPSHISRVTGDSRAFWVYDGPYYHLDERGRLVRDGSFSSGRVATTQVYRWFGALKERSHFLRLINMDLPISISRDDVLLTAKVIAAARDAYAEQFDGVFHVLFHPTWNLDVAMTADQHRILESALVQAGVRVLDYAGDGLQPDEIISKDCDPHPNGKLNAWLASVIVADLPTTERGDFR